MDDEVIEQVEFEIEQIDQLFRSYSDLLAQARDGTLDLVDVTAIAAVLHSFYNGLENIFLSITKGIDEDVPRGSEWHSNLLMRMAESTRNRGAVLLPETAQQLTDFLAFRHFFRHSYSFFLEWRKMEKLVTPLPEIWQQVRQELQAFLDSLRVK